MSGKLNSYSEATSPLKTRIMYLKIIFILAALDFDGTASGKGLDELGQSNPENLNSSPDPSNSTEADGQTSAKSNAQTIDSASIAGRTLSEKLQIGTSYGWVKASKAQGQWTTSGMSDITVAYEVARLNSKTNIFGTFRYAPIAVSGKQDRQLYRGVWEVYNLGARAHYLLKQDVIAVLSGEIGYVRASLTPIDSLPETAKHSVGGAMLTIGGGADVALAENKTILIGPRLFAGFGSYSVYQVSAAASFLF